VTAQGNVPGTGINAQANLPTASGAVGAQTGAAATGNVAGANVGANLGAKTTAKWATTAPQQLTKVDTNLSSALKASTTTNVTPNAANITAGATTGTTANATAAVSPFKSQQAAFMSGWANGVRTNYFIGGTPFFGGTPFYNQGFWTGRNLIGLGISALTGTPYGYGGLYGGMGGGWWGYSPWLGYQPYSYWWGNPGWAGINNWVGYGWNSPYVYDYGPGGTVVYQGNQVLVNSQPVATTSEYAQSAAALATIDASMVANVKPEDWMPLGTFSLATSANEKNPSRVIQLALAKQGLISGTIFNRSSGNTYTVQGRVDPNTQRVAFTIGNQMDTVFETGLFNLTQNEAPLLVHFGPTQTQTYFVARLPAPETTAEATTQSAAVPQPAIAR
jgi:hypothetical protein